MYSPARPSTRSGSPARWSQSGSPGSPSFTASCRSRTPVGSRASQWARRARAPSAPPPGRSPPPPRPAPPAVGIGLESLQPPALPFLLASEVDVVALAARVRRGIGVDRLRAHRDLARRERVVAILGMGEEDAAVPSLEGQRVSRGSGQP